MSSTVYYGLTYYLPNMPLYEGFSFPTDIFSKVKLEKDHVYPVFLNGEGDGTCLDKSLFNKYSWAVVKFSDYTQGPWYVHVNEFEVVYTSSDRTQVINQLKQYVGTGHKIIGDVIKTPSTLHIMSGDWSNLYVGNNSKIITGDLSKVRTFSGSHITLGRNCSVECDDYSTVISKVYSNIKTGRFSTVLCEGASLSYRGDTIVDVGRESNVVIKNIYSSYDSSITIKAGEDSTIVVISKEKVNNKVRNLITTFYIGNDSSYELLPYTVYKLDRNAKLVKVNTREITNVK